MSKTELFSTRKVLDESAQRAKSLEINYNNNTENYFKSRNKYLEEIVEKSNKNVSNNIQLIHLTT